MVFHVLVGSPQWQLVTNSVEEALVEEIKKSDYKR